MLLVKVTTFKGFKNQVHAQHVDTLHTQNADLLNFRKAYKKPYFFLFCQKGMMVVSN